MLSNAELVKAVLGGDRAAFAALVQRYERAVLGVATSVLEDHHAAQDAAQEAFMVAYRRLDSLRNGSTFGAWLLRITHRQAVRMARQRSRAAEVVRPADDPAADRDGRLDDASQTLLAEVMRLPRHEREVLMHKHFAGHSVRTIAEMTGRPLTLQPKSTMSEDVYGHYFVRADKAPRHHWRWSLIVPKRANVNISNDVVSLTFRHRTGGTGSAGILPLVIRRDRLAELIVATQRLTLPADSPPEAVMTLEQIEALIERIQQEEARPQQAGT